MHSRSLRNFQSISLLLWEKLTIDSLSIILMVCKTRLVGYNICSSVHHVRLVDFSNNFMCDSCKRAKSAQKARLRLAHGSTLAHDATCIMYIYIYVYMLHDDSLHLHLAKKFIIISPRDTRTSQLPREGDSFSSETRERERDFIMNLMLRAWLFIGC